MKSCMAERAAGVHVRSALDRRPQDLHMPPSGSDMKCWPIASANKAVRPASQES